MTHHPSFGTILSWDPAGGTAYGAIAQVRDIDGPGLARGDIDTTDHDSANGAREFLPGLVDGGDISFELGWDPHDADHASGAGTGLIGDFVNDGCTLPTWTLVNVTCAGTVTVAFSGYVKQFQPSWAVEGQLIAACALKVSGLPTFTVA